MNLGVTEQSYNFGGTYIRDRSRSGSNTGKTVEKYPWEMPEDSRPKKPAPANQESAIDIYNRMRHIRTLDIPEDGQDKDASNIPDDGIPEEKSSNKSVSEELLEETSDEPEEEEEAKSDSDIIVKPDGSRVLVMTMTLGGMKTSMSLEISGPTAMANDCRMGDETSLGLAVNLSEQNTF